VEDLAAYIFRVHFTLNMKATRSSEILASYCDTTCYHNPKDLDLRTLTVPKNFPQSINGCSWCMHSSSLPEEMHKYT
jgi:hypothetical protein